MDISVAQVTDTHFADDLARIMIAAWRAGFRGILSDETIAKYTQFEPCTAMFSQLLSSGDGTMYRFAGWFHTTGDRKGRFYAKYL